MPERSCSRSDSSLTVLPRPGKSTLTGHGSNPSRRRSIHQPPGVARAAFDPSVEPVPPPATVVVPDSRATTGMSGETKCTWVSTVPAGMISPLPLTISVEGPMTGPGWTPSMMPGLPHLPSATIRPSHWSLRPRRAPHPGTGRVLRLDAESAAYLMSLAGPKRRRGRGRPVEHVPVGLDALLHTLKVPAVVFDKYSDVLAANRLARPVTGPGPGGGRLRVVFTDRAAREYHTGWERYTAVAVARLRSQAGIDTDDGRLHALFGELSVKSDRFGRLRGRHDVRSAQGVTFRVRHPWVGPLELMVEKFQAAGAAGLEAMLLHAGPGTSPADVLALLASLDASA